MRRLPDTNAQARTILVATSGDTGAAVGAAFTGLAGFRVIILYPEGRVSPRQAHQLGVFADNVSALCLRASFDDCQRLVKQAFADTQLRNDVALSSANSISLGRLLPQMAYFAHSALAHRREHGTALNFVVPTGNLGNVFACTLARASGLPIGRIVLACNANDVLPNFFAGAEYTPRAGVATIANAMDVGAPSNFERLRWMYPDSSALRGEFRAFSVDDAAIRATIHEQYENYGQVFCPHTATAVHALTRLRAEGAGGDWAIAATAHPAKFDQIIEPLIGHPVAIPPTLNELLSRESVAEPLAVDYEAFRDHLLNPHQTSHK